MRLKSIIYLFAFLPVFQYSLTISGRNNSCIALNNRVCYSKDELTITKLQEITLLNFLKENYKNEPLEVSLIIVNTTFLNKFDTDKYLEGKMTVVEFIIIDKDIFGVLFNIQCNAGGYCSEYYFATITDESIPIDLKFLGTESGDLYFQSDFFYEKKSDHNFTVIGHLKNLNDEEEIISEKILKQTLSIQPNGLLEITEIIAN